jgi:hypothetical protein
MRIPLYDGRPRLKFETKAAGRLTADELACLFRTGLPSPIGRALLRGDRDHRDATPEGDLISISLLAKPRLGR